MIPRSGSIFTVGEEGERATPPPAMAAAAVAVAVAGVRIPRGRHLVGLRILIQSPSSSYSSRELKVVAKSSVRLPSSPSASPASFSSSFLKACRLCNKELSPLDDVYMYRGDQGFCSVDCRCRQISLDERRELEAAAKARLPTPPRLRSGHRFRDSDRRRRILAVS